MYKNNINDIVIFDLKKMCNEVKIFIKEKQFEIIKILKKKY